MAAADPRHYLNLVYQEIPRILSLQDRNSFSPSYGCFNRNYWLHRLSDFPSSINQLGVHTLALLWKHKLEDNIYYQNPRIREWCLAGIDYWMKIQKSDGSFDEWYPNERGWAGPTGYLVHAMASAYFLLGEAFPADWVPRFKSAMRKAGQYLVDYNEEYVLANHHAIALLPIYEAYLVTGDENLRVGFDKRFEEFLGYCYEEGWCLEYDGVDIGYLAGTVSFLASLHQHYKDPRIETVVKRAIEFSSYHLYPNGSYGGTTGSRQTVHFYPGGYEYWGKKYPLAQAMAERALHFSQRGLMVPPGTQEDHYVLYRLPEYIEAYLQYAPRAANLPALPYEQPDFEKFWPQAKVFVKKCKDSYWVINLDRGGVVKGFAASTGKILLNDCGWITRLDDGKVLTSQWNDSTYRTDYKPDNLSVAGSGHFMVTKLFTPLKMILFRIFMISFGWHAAAAYQIKALIRRLLMVGVRRGPVHFERKICFSPASFTLTDEIRLDSDAQVRELRWGGEFFVRYVPQSRYFQPYELETPGEAMSADAIAELNRNRRFSRTLQVPF